MISGLIPEYLVEMTPPVSVTAALGLLMCLGFFTLTSALSESPLPGILKLKGYPILGAIPIYFRDGMALMLEKLTTLADDGISYAQVGNKILVSVHDPTMAKEVLAFTDKVASRLGDPRVFSWSPFWTLIRLLDNNLFDDVGHEAMRQRGMFNREFSNPASNVGKFDGIMEVASAHVESIAGSLDRGEVVADIRRAADTYGLAPGKPVASEAKVRAEIESIYDRNVEHLEEYESNNPEAPMKTIRSLSVADGGKRSGPLTKFAIQFARLNVFGGHHGIGSNITWIMIELQRRPEILAKLLAEIDSFDAIDFTTVTTKMPYLDAVVMEINRLYPSVPATLRVIERETGIRSCKKPVALKPGMLVYLSYLHMHTSPKYWGSDAGEFDPNRFLNGIDKSRPFMPFGSGTRDCVGYKFALLSVKVFLVTLLKTYDFKVEENNCTPKLNTLLETSGPVRVEFSRRA
ncbi:putative cytochrome P450 [Boeremia exigua]|uniref:putative cytochrome P450 n=1 Tax=Boeremia exigua TaxID=749465 RepID=UPI001E8DBB4C|nr:putative cytochrome P450 [Boeremia exigua]KAH6612080.1 putative cytochrome P450 [Boeremia exigua]